MSDTVTVIAKNASRIETTEQNAIFFNLLNGAKKVEANGKKEVTWKGRLISADLTQVKDKPGFFRRIWLALTSEFTKTFDRGRLIQNVNFFFTDGANENLLERKSLADLTQMSANLVKLQNTLEKPGSSALAPALRKLDEVIGRKLPKNKADNLVREQAEPAARGPSLKEAAAQSLQDAINEKAVQKAKDAAIAKAAAKERRAEIEYYSMSDDSDVEEQEVQRAAAQESPRSSPTPQSPASRSPKHRRSPVHKESRQPVVSQPAVQSQPVSSDSNTERLGKIQGIADREGASTMVGDITNPGNSIEINDDYYAKPKALTLAPVVKPKAVSAEQPLSYGYLRS